MGVFVVQNTIIGRAIRPEGAGAMPKLPGVVETLDTVPAAAHEFYTEVDGRFVLDLEAVDGHPLTAGGKKAIEAERKARQAAEEALKPWKGLGLTPEQVAEIRAKAEVVPPGDPDATQRLIDKRVKEALEGVKPQLDRLTALEQENRQLKVTDGIRAAFIAAEGEEADADDVVRLVELGFKLNDKGKLVRIDDDGDEMTKSPKDWFATDYKKAKPKYFKGPPGSGSGARGTEGGGEVGAITLTREQASDAATYAEAVKKVGGDYSKVKVAPTV